MERNLCLKTLGSQKHNGGGLGVKKISQTWRKLQALLAQKLFWTFFRAVYFLDYLNNVKVSSDAVKVGLKGQLSFPGIVTPFSDLWIQRSSISRLFSPLIFTGTDVQTEFLYKERKPKSFKLVIFTLST